MLPRWRDPPSRRRWILAAAVLLVAVTTVIGVDAKRRWDRVEAFCRDIRVGMHSEELPGVARLHRVAYTVGALDQRSGLFLVREHTLLGTFFCDVSFADGTVASKRVGSQ